MRIGILTGGGDVPGLNPCIKTLVYGAIERNWQVVGIRRGWAGMLQLDPAELASLSQGTLELNRQNTRTIDRSGGTFLHTSRLNPARLHREQLPAALSDLPTTPDGLVDATPHVLAVVDWLGLDVLVPIGGDETLAFAQRLSASGVPIVAVPKTMDNDVFGTDYCLGFSTAVSRSVQFINQIRSSAGSHERVAIVELLGRHSGETALLASYLAGADRVLIPEVAVDLARLAELVGQDKRANPSNYAIVTIGEGARPAGAPAASSVESSGGQPVPAGIGHRTATELQRLLGEEVLEQQVGYLMRSGAPDGLDLMVADNFAALTLQLIEQDASGRLVALRHGCYTTVPLDVVLEGTKGVDVPELYDPERYLPRVRHVEGKPMFLY
jgi:6-phosphofructokinase 1